MAPVVVSYYCHKCRKNSPEKPNQTTVDMKAFFWCPKCWFIHLEDMRKLSENNTKKIES